MSPLPAVLPCGVCLGLCLCLIVCVCVSVSLHLRPRLLFLHFLFLSLCICFCFYSVLLSLLFFCLPYQSLLLFPRLSVSCRLTVCYFLPVSCCHFLSCCLTVSSLPLCLTVSVSLPISCSLTVSVSPCLFLFVCLCLSCLPGPGRGGAQAVGPAGVLWFSWAVGGGKSEWLWRGPGPSSIHMEFASAALSSAGSRAGNSRT